MNRVAAGMALSLALTGCSSLPSFSPGDWLPNFGGGGGGGYPLRLDSIPPGAEARTSLGQGCRTPCTISVPAREDFTVTFALPGYETQMVPVDLVRSGGGFGTATDFATTVQFTPNPVVAMLEPAAPPPAAKKRAAKPRPRTTAKTAPASGAAPAAAPPAASDVPASQRTIPGAQPTAPPASAWPPPTR
jgi:hypothetical protein